METKTYRQVQCMHVDFGVELIRTKGYLDKLSNDSTLSFITLC